MVKLFSKDSKFYYMGNLSDMQAETLLALRSADVVSELKNCIFNLSQQEIDTLSKLPTEEYKNYAVFTRDGISKLGANYSRGTLTDAQTKGVAFMYYAGSALLGDDVGLGKTVQVAGLINVLSNEYAKVSRPFRYCFLTESQPVLQIYNKLLRFTGAPAYLLDSATKRKVDKFIEDKNTPNVSVVGTHALLKSKEFLTYSALNPFDLIIIDESSVIKNTSSDVYKKAKVFLGSAYRKVLLNATPLETNCMEFYNQLDLLDPNFLPSRSDFQKQFCVIAPDFRNGFSNRWIISAYKNQDVFKQLISLRYLARNRSELGAEYINNYYECVLVEPSKEQSKLLKNSSLYLMVYDFPPAVDRTLEASLDNIPKAQVLLDLVKQEKAKGKRSIVYCRFIEAQKFLVDVLESNGFSTLCLNGEMTKKQSKEIQGFINNGDFDVLVTDIEKGLDIESADTCIFYSINPNPQKMVQFEGRMVRRFDVVDKSVYLLILKGKEEKFVREVVVPRVNATCDFTNAAESLTINVLQEVDS